MKCIAAGAAQFVRSACMIAALVVALAGCATPPTDPAARAAFDEANDPLEPMNRGIFFFNRATDALFIKPAAMVYRTLMPRPGQLAIRNVLNNLDTPVVLINQLFQGKFDPAGRTVERFFINSTFGVLGLVDVADTLGIKREDADFGQTLDSWGMGSGPYLMLPLFGPSNARDTVGLVVDNFMDPLGYVGPAAVERKVAISRFAADGIDQRAQSIDALDSLEKTSVDFYAQLRSVAQQHRAAELNHPSSQMMSPDDSLYDTPLPTKP
jgi:phospholipid-binding lipoprotein MlaA